jgi:serine/threonine protein kinase/Flp pilus assembly protein TadD
MNDPSPLEAVFFTALEKGSPQERATYLDEACAGDLDLRRRVEKMIAAQAQAGSFLEQPAHGLVMTADEPPAAEAAGTVIGPYRLLEEIGEGGMGTVWMAQQTEPVKRVVALKLIKAGMDSKQVIARFEAERQALALMEHPNIARVLDAGTTTAGRPYFVMDLVKGVPITRYCDGNQLTFRERLELFLPICQAVQHAHQKGIIHRDLKPSNVMVALYDERPVPKVIDFGVAKATGPKLTEQTLFTQFGQLVGTLEYMSPEQATLNALDVDTRSDIYSLGVLLYELLTGSTPLEKKRLKETAFDEVLRIIREEDLPTPSTRLAGSRDTLPAIAAQRKTEPGKLARLVRGDLDWIVMRALDKDRNRRYETASALAADLQRYLHDEPVHACPPSALYRFRKFARRNKAVLPIASSLFLAVAVVAVGLGWVAGDRAARRAKAAENVEDALQKAVGFLKDEDSPRARAATERAAGLLAGADADEVLQQRLKQVQTDLDMVAKLELARLQKAEVKNGYFDLQGANPAFAIAFRDYNLPVLDLEPSEAARRIAASAIREQLLAALVDWADLKTDPADKKKLTAVIRMSDTDPWRQQVFDVVDHKNWPQLARLARQPEALASSLAQTDMPAAVEFLRQAQRGHPDDFWINHNLAFYLTQLKPARLEEAVGFFRVAVALRPQSPGAHLNLGDYLHNLGRWPEAEAEARAAIRLKKDYAEAHCNLGLVLMDKRQLDDAIVEFREALRIKKNLVQAHNGLGACLVSKGQLDKAIVELREALRLKKDYAEAHNNLGTLLYAKGNLNDAIAAYREAIRLKSDFPEAHYSLGTLLSAKGHLNDAIAAYREAIRLKSDYPEAHNNLGNALKRKGLWDEAIDEYREALRINKDLPQAHGNLGTALLLSGDLEGAIRELQVGIQIRPKDAEAHCNLGLALGRQGQFRQAVEELRLGHKLGARNPQWRYPSARWLRDAERQADLDARLPKILKGEDRPADAGECLAVAHLCQHHKELNAAAARFYGEAFAADPKLGEDLSASYRYDAACAAALGGCGQGKDAGHLEGKERERLRRQALAWLQADLAAFQQQMARESTKAGSMVQKSMRHWQQDEDFAGVRGDASAKLPEAERKEWQKLWQDVEALGRRAAGSEKSAPSKLLLKTQERLNKTGRR